MHDARDYEIRICYSTTPGDGCYIAQVVEWPGIMAHGDSRAEAAQEIELALESALEFARERGVTPPVPHALAVTTN
jgi:predicted RNase H-like HicB family nuclease